MKDYFPEKPWACHCGCGFDAIDSKLVEMLNQARERANIPFIITSACRCEKYNAEVGGKFHSAHTRGLAVDISYENGEILYKIVRSLLLVGFARLEIGRTDVGRGWIHVDRDLEKPWPCMWVEI